MTGSEKCLPAGLRLLGFQGLLSCVFFLNLKMEWMFSSSNAVARHSNVKRESFSPVLLTFTVLGQGCVPAYLPVPPFFHSTPPLPLLQQGTDERSKVSPVEEAAFCRSHASASLHTYSRRFHRIPAGGGPNSAGSHYRCCPNAHTQISINAHFEPCSWWEWHSATSDPFCVLPNHHQDTLSLRTLHALLEVLLELRHQSYTKALTPVIQQLSVISFPSQIISNLNSTSSGSNRHKTYWAHFVFNLF